jgi:hypothetical protein
MSRATSRRVLLLLAIGAMAAISAWAWRSWMGEPGAALAGARALAPAVALAAERIRVHQTAAGYWPSAVTQGPTFAKPGTQVNVFVSAMVVDLVGPVAGEVGLDDVTARARAWLGSQIEETGLVRYHGTPGPGPPPKPGCELPPDSDDTALAWRLAPRSDPELLASALRTIDQYRTADGLYRVWLAPEDTHRCFYEYSGRVLNPPDVAVQMHIHLFLAGRDPEAARRLCGALEPRMADDQIWVYYAVAPLIPRLRELDLARAGCSLRVPEARLRAQPPEQALYLEVAEQRRLLLDQDAPGARRALLVALGRLAADGFAALERTPPLLYHNDLTATPPHFHWSADVGYALWLRAYADAVGRPGAGGPVGSGPR